MLLCFLTMSARLPHPPRHPAYRCLPTSKRVAHSQLVLRAESTTAQACAPSSARQRSSAQAGEPLLREQLSQQQLLRPRVPSLPVPKVHAGNLKFTGLTQSLGEI